MAALSATEEIAWAPTRPRRTIQAAAVALAAGLIGITAFVAGQHHHPSGVTMLTGVAYTGGQQMSVVVDGWAYGLDGPGNLTWVDREGTTHIGGWPSCLATPGATHRIRFGYMPVTLPDGTGSRQVVWIDCRA
jgi:hypothetical protein